MQAVQQHGAGGMQVWGIVWGTLAGCVAWGEHLAAAAAWRGEHPQGVAQVAMGGHGTWLCRGVVHSCGVWCREQPQHRKRLLAA